MVQGAVHDALNAIKPRYAAYYYEATAAAGAVPEAAVAAASRTVLVAVIPSFGAPPQRTDALALVEEAYRAALAGIPGQSCEGEWHRGWAGGRRGDAGAAQGRWRHAQRSLHAGERARPLAAAPEPRSSESSDQGSESRARHRRFRLAWLGQRHSVHAAVGVAVLATRSAGADERAVRAGLQRSEVRRRPGEHRSHPRADRDRALLVRGARILVSRCARRVRGPRARLMGQRTRTRRRVVRDGRRLHRRASRSVTSTTSGGRSPPSGKRRKTATTPPSRIPTWNSNQNTPSVSDYPSTQSIFSGAAPSCCQLSSARTRSRFTMTSGPPFANIKRSYTSLSQAARESADSRIYAGIHFRSACEDGLVLGRKIGQRVAISYPATAAQLRCLWRRASGRAVERTRLRSTCLSESRPAASGLHQVRL